MASFGNGEPDILLMASGSEVTLIYDAARKLADEGVNVRVVSFPSWELFEQQSAGYRASVLPAGVTRRLAVEAGVAQGWERYVGSSGRIVSIERFGASAPYKTIFEHLGFTVDNVYQQAKSVLAGARKLSAVGKATGGRRVSKKVRGQ